MHEVSAAHGVLQALIEEARRHGLARVVSARVVVNEVDGLSAENLAYWVRMLGEGTCVEGVEIDVRSASPNEPGCPPPGLVGLEMVQGMTADARGRRD